jgi:MFS family permease
LGIGGLPFLLPLLFQIGLNFTPIQSGLMIMPQSLSALTLKLAVPHILARFGFRKVLLYNALILGVFTISFSMINLFTPVWGIVLLSGLFGFFSSLQFTSMNTLVYSDIDEANTSQASTIVSTAQQISMSFGVAVASLIASVFIPKHL